MGKKLWPLCFFLFYYFFHFFSLFLCSSHILQFIYLVHLMLFFSVCDFSYIFQMTTITKSYRNNNFIQINLAQWKLLYVITVNVICCLLQSYFISPIFSTLVNRNNQSMLSVYFCPNLITLSAFYCTFPIRSSKPKDNIITDNFKRIC